MKIARISDILKRARESERTWRVSVAYPHEEEILGAVIRAKKEGFADPVVFGHRKEIEAMGDEIGLGRDARDLNIVEVEDSRDAVRRAVEEVYSGNGDVLLKGLVSTAGLIRAVLSRELGTRSGRLLSHVAVFDAPIYDRLMILTDAGINITPDVDRKVRIIRNAVHAAQSLGIERPYVAMLAAIDKLNYPAMKATLDAALVSKIAASGVIQSAVVEGPFALDNAVSLASVETKGTEGQVAGRADILVAPEIETANVLYKALQCFCNVTFASVVVGGSRPLAVPSRADSVESKLTSIALACLMSSQAKNPA